jgi:membrane protease YdiL (CAAX protease family)
VGALRINGLAGDRGQVAVRVTAVVAVAGAGGALFSWLRARSGSLTTPVLLHLSTNCAGLLAAWTASRVDKPETS